MKRIRRFVKFAFCCWFSWFSKFCISLFYFFKFKVAESLPFLPALNCSGLNRRSLTPTKVEKFFLSMLEEIGLRWRGGFGAFWAMGLTCSILTLFMKTSIESLAWCELDDWGCRAFSQLECFLWLLTLILLRATSSALVIMNYCRDRFKLFLLST